MEFPGSVSKPSTAPVPCLWITGIAAQYPPYLLTPEEIEAFAKRFYDVEKPGLKKLLRINKSTGIETRASISDYATGFATRQDPPDIADIDNLYRQVGVDLAAQACRKAIKEWGGTPADITHTVAVTCTNQGSPGYDLLVAGRLGIPNSAERLLLHGVGCAGGLAIMRTAAQIACSATVRKRPARVLAFACELCTPNARCALAEAEACSNPEEVSIAGALFSDGAAAFVLCNEYGMLDGDTTALFQLIEWGSETIPSSAQYMGIYAEPMGFRTVLTRQVPEFTKMAIRPMFETLLSSFQEKVGHAPVQVGMAEFDWALHPGGDAILNGAQQALDLTDEQLRASREIYRTRGNSSSSSVLAVLDLLRKMGNGEDFVVATSFGPGLVIEMALLTRCRT